MASADAAFNQADANRDGRVDLGEFRNFVGKSILVLIDINESHHNHCRFFLQDKILVLVVLVPVMALVLVMVPVLAMELVHHHSNHHRTELVLVQVLA